MAFTGLVCLVVLLVGGCTATVEPHPPVHIKMAGSTAMFPLVEELASAYSERYDYVRIDIESRGTRLGLEALREGAVDIALVSRELKPDESEGLEATVIAYDAIAVLVNDQNAVESLSSEQLRDIFSGGILLWSEVGGDEVEIQVLSREDGSGTRDAFEDMVMEGQRVTTMAMVVPGSEAVGTFVAENPLTIGYSSAVGVPLGARSLRIDGESVGLEAVAQRRYPLVRPFVLATRADSGEEIQSFIDFVLSPAGQVIVGRRYGRAR